MIADVPENALFVLRRLKESGHDAYLVGGCVRDTVMGRLPHDWDVATSARTDEIARLFAKTVMTGARFGGVTVVFNDKLCSAVEVTTYRTDGDYTDSRRPDNVVFTDSLEADLSRRDFTMNAMAAGEDGQLIDPFGGLSAVNARIIRCVGDPNLRFSEDALRMFRAFRFSAELGFSIEPETLDAITLNSGKAGSVSAERVQAELELTILSQKPEIIGDIIRAGLLDRYLSKPGSEIDTSVSMQVGLGKIAMLPPEPVLRWCALCSVLIMFNFIDSGAGFLRAQRLGAKTVSCCSAALSLSAFPDDRPGVKRLLAAYGVEAVRCAAACAGVHALSETDAIISSGECFSLSDLAVTGNDLLILGYPQSREIGDALDRLLNYVIDHPDDNTFEALIRML